MYVQKRLSRACNDQSCDNVLYLYVIVCACIHSGAVVRVVNSEGTATNVFTLLEGDIGNTTVSVCIQLLSGGGGREGLERNVTLTLTTGADTAGKIEPMCI